METNIDLIVIGKKIKDARLDQGLTQEALATMIGIHPSHLSEIENGKKAMRITTFVNIAKVLHLPSDFFVGDIIGINDTLNAERFIKMVNKVNESEKKKIIDILKILAQ